MPAIITHDLFAKDIYGDTFTSVGGSRDEAEAFLLGNQGPDPLFFIAPDPRYRRVGKLASTLHRTRPAEFLVALKGAVRKLPARERSMGRAYVMGYVCHYLLDRAVHPLILSQVHALCDAGVEGLGAEDASEVHAVVETELDELVLTAKRGETVATYRPATAILKGRDGMLDAVGRLYAAAAREAFDLDVPPSLFKSAVRANRLAQQALYSPTGAKRAVLSAAERLVRPHAMTDAMSHRASERTYSAFANAERAPWRHPATDAESHASFWDLYDQARVAALEALAVLDADDFDLDAAHRLTVDMNFYGEPVVALVVSVEDAESAPAAERG
ncbi:zinc dependent phospholipase C family protein [Adlercreutzia sp. R25]|uniref:Zinc dependent phospholipase C family protein n=1 Tax=Adlercreutzia shanghongiae TaxID=3111773 RepID=A0ABU6IY23_9ACTN|nr:MULTISPECIES: zinc dependent phospholipase C family protein [unclassified Adlercreutzia]MEC4271679.1 zinc dependent phospholipase C family protein [Adlercreutzia sp. R25]MEC4294685.1 zinc dependent phospholipase C family protein [Adlercreutzia sp. R22]